MTSMSRIGGPSERLFDSISSSSKALFKVPKAVSTLGHDFGAAMFAERLPFEPDWTAKLNSCPCFFVF